MRDQSIVGGENYGSSAVSAIGESTQGPPPLRPFGLRLHHDGRWSHEGQSILNRRLREAFDRSVVYLPDEAKYVVRLGHFRGQIEVEEAGFFVLELDLDAGQLRLSDGTIETFDLAGLEVSGLDGAFLCRVKRDLLSEGLWARFSHSAQAEFLGAVREESDGWSVELEGDRRPLPEGLEE
ncbi:MAG: hypothetical protein CL917_00295 [Deltaproteobacteria bacterium]|nr:hypothetical protein [Deltaproteobacteria bacterium]